MHCSKIGGQCQHPTMPDNNLVFVMMPFKGFDNIYDAISIAIEGVDAKAFRCERADAHYTNLSIWCDRICKNIRKAKYLVADAVSQNANVYYELGFAHATEGTRVILITQDDLKDAPFDIASLNHIPYSADKLKELRIIMNDFKAAFGAIGGKLKEFENRKDQIIALYLELVCRRILGMKAGDLESMLSKLLENGFSSSWSFLELENWLNDTPIADDVKNYIRKKTELLKKHQQS